jgi:hypothetical protein
MGKTFKNIRRETRDDNYGKSKTVNREDKTFDKYKKSIYNIASLEEFRDDLYDEFDDNTDHESNHTKSIHRK